MQPLDVSIPLADGSHLPGVLVQPDPERFPGKRPALLQIYEILGMNDEMKRVAQDFANQGYAVLIPDLFSRAPHVLCVARAIRALRSGAGPEFGILTDAKTFLAQQPFVAADRMGVVGFCMGGGFALLLAARGGFRAAAPFYGDVPEEARMLSGICPVVASFGGKDKIFAPNAERLESHLTKLGVLHEVKVYPDAGHSFMTHSTGWFASLVAPISPMNLGYHDEAAKDSWQRMLGFFETHLAETPAK